ncbi:hypothetical protein M758_8G055100 [Ceratodon purpureus]|uniref:Protein kinase domain-containing protein n=1 Tax=Ceratodon purpureus TaxID=3225 RepID=A0A8T0H093_CERPU|nr:hypothetical protein KC19_8G057900 [Ceratodon purpureus]KAG0607791.1 hypothetical protein M758_8G055100 [Ceratodon purpureus]
MTNTRNGPVSPTMAIKTTTLLLVIFSIVSATVGQDLAADTKALLIFSTIHDPKGTKMGWSNLTSTCTWRGITCEGDRVTEVRLPGKGFRGEIPAGSLGLLSELRVVSLRGNKLTGLFPGELGDCNKLEALYLARNDFYGPVLTLTGLWPRLTRLSLEANKINGSIPDSIGLFKDLYYLNLRNNSFSGSIPPLNLANLTIFDVANNNLSGPIPPTLSRFLPAAFLGNPGLCGAPLTVCPGTLEPTSAPIATSSNGHKLSTGAIVGIVVGAVAFLALVVLGLFFCLCRRKKEKRENVGKPGEGQVVSRDLRPREKGVEVQTEEYYSATGEKLDRSKLVFFDDKKYSFDLDDLLRASAEVLGKGSVGTAYKAILEDGTIMAVKRLKDVTTGKKEFESQIQVVGKMQHRNVVPLRAYYFSKDEKLLVYDFMNRGSLSALLHGNRGSTRIPLDWSSRVKIATGAARGLAYLHAQGGPKFVHANIKSSNILLNTDLNACISDFGLAQLITSSSAQAKIIGYRAPEVTELRKATQKSDVFSFGVLLLELLTGKAPTQAALNDEGIDLPRWVQSIVREEWTTEVFDAELLRYNTVEGEMVNLLQIAMRCVDTVPERRPTMSEVQLLLEDVRQMSMNNSQEITSRQSVSPPEESPVRASVSRDRISQQGTPSHSRTTP